MGGDKRRKREKGGNSDDDSKSRHRSSTSDHQPSQMLPSMIKNKQKRSEIHSKLKHQKKVDKRKKIKARDGAEKRAVELGEEESGPRFVLKLISLQHGTFDSKGGEFEWNHHKPEMDTGRRRFFL